MKKIELLSPAKNIETAICAIDYGADAIYIGANSFGARVNAANSVSDIAKSQGKSIKYTEHSKIWACSSLICHL